MNTDHQNNPSLFGGTLQRALSHPDLVIATNKRQGKFLRSCEFFDSSKLAYPYGYNEDGSNDEREKIDLINNARLTSEKAFRARQDFAQEDADAGIIDIRPALDSGLTNAHDSVREGCFAEDSLAFWQCAHGSADEILATL